MTDEDVLLRQRDVLVGEGCGEAGVQCCAVAGEQLGNGEVHRIAGEVARIAGEEIGCDRRDDDDAVGRLCQRCRRRVVEAGLGQKAVLQIDQSLRRRLTRRDVPVRFGGVAVAAVDLERRPRDPHVVVRRHGRRAGEHLHERVQQVEGEGADHVDERRRCGRRLNGCLRDESSARRPMSGLTTAGPPAVGPVTATRRRTRTPAAPLP